MTTSSLVLMRKSRASLCWVWSVENVSDAGKNQNCGVACEAKDEGSLWFFLCVKDLRRSGPLAHCPKPRPCKNESPGEPGPRLLTLVRRYTTDIYVIPFTGGADIFQKSQENPNTKRELADPPISRIRLRLIGFTDGDRRNKRASYV